MIGLIITIRMMFNIIKKESIKCSYAETAVISFLAVITIFLCTFSLTRDLSVYLYVLLFSWLLLLAYVDKLCGYVYDIMEYYGVVFVAGGICKIIINNEMVLQKLILVLFSVLICYLSAKAGFFGAGDADVFAVIFLMFSDLYTNILFYGITVTLFILRYIGEVIKNKGKLESPKPLIPSIYMTYVLFIIFYCL